MILFFSLVFSSSSSSIFLISSFFLPLSLHRPLPPAPPVSSSSLSFLILFLLPFPHPLSSFPSISLSPLSSSSLYLIGLRKYSNMYTKMEWSTTIVIKVIIKINVVSISKLVIRKKEKRKQKRKKGKKNIRLQAWFEASRFVLFLVLPFPDLKGRLEAYRGVQ